MSDDQRGSKRLTDDDGPPQSVKASQFQMTPLVDLVQDALVRAGLSQKAAALTMRIDQAQLSRALAGKNALDLHRLEMLGPEFWREFIKALAPVYGLSVTVVDERQQLLVRMATALNDLLQYEAKR